MKVFLCIIALLILSACSQSEIEPRDRSVIIEDLSGKIQGRGVILDSVSLMTALHVWKGCEKRQCIYRLPPENTGKILSVSYRDERRDIAILEIDEPSMGDLPRARDILPGSSVSALVYRSGSWVQIEGKLIGGESDYIGVDMLGTPQLYTGAIETDIVLEAGESGTPIWTDRGELIGIMSAVDREGRRGWVVR